MDSGSSDTWVPSQVRELLLPSRRRSNCVAQACSNCGPQTTLGTKTSSTFQASNKTFAVTYGALRWSTCSLVSLLTVRAGTGEVDGAIIKDDMTIGTLKLPGHVFGAATSESVEFSTAPFDGLMGLAQSKLSASHSARYDTDRNSRTGEQGVLTPIESLADQGLTTASQMGYKLARVADGANQQDSQITFGGVDAAKFTGSLTLIDNVSKDGFWEAPLTDATVNGKSLKLPSGRSAILDTGAWARFGQERR
jgi:hypothetical protein